MHTGKIIVVYDDVDYETTIANVYMIVNKEDEKNTKETIINGNPKEETSYNDRTIKQVFINRINSKNKWNPIEIWTKREETKYADSNVNYPI